MTVRIVAFDAGLTLLRAEPSFWDAFAEGVRRAGARLPEPPDVVDHTPFRGLWERHDAAWEAAGRPSPHIGDATAERDYWCGLYHRFLSHLDVDGDLEAVAAAVHEHFSAPGVFRPFPDVDATLTALADRGCRLALLSNWSPSLRAILRAEDLHDHFEAIVISGEEGVAKPTPAIYHHLLEALGEPAGAHIAYVGDSVPHDVVPARELGLVPVLIDRFGRHDGHDGARIRELAGLERVLDLPDAPG